MRFSTSLLLAISMALIGMAAASQRRGLHHPVWVRSVAPGPSGTPSGTTTTTTHTTTSSFSRPTGTVHNGNACSASAQCHSGNCQHSVCRDPQPLGQTGCYKDLNCASGHCSNGKCVPPEGKGVTGDVCNASTQCSSGNCWHSKCTPKQSLGATCYKNQNCMSGNCVKSKCIADASVANGDSCTASQQCTPGNYCRHGECSPKREKGHKCYKDQGCISNWCDHSRCA